MTGDLNREVAAVTEEFGAFEAMSPAREPVHPASGTGGLVKRGDANLEMVAARKKWAIPDSVFDRLPSRMEEIANSESRQAVAAAKVLLDMNEQNDSSGSGQSSGGDVVIYIPDNGRGQ